MLTHGATVTLGLWNLVPISSRQVGTSQTVHLGSHVPSTERWPYQCCRSLLSSVLGDSKMFCVGASKRCPATQTANVFQRGAAALDIFKHGCRHQLHCFLWFLPQLLSKDWGKNWQGPYHFLSTERQFVRNRATFNLSVCLWNAFWPPILALIFHCYPFILFSPYCEWQPLKTWCQSPSPSWCSAPLQSWL